MRDTQSIEFENRRKYSGDAYDARTICARLENDAKDYSSRMLQLKIDMVKRQCPGNVLVDLCCGAGGSLQATAGNRTVAIGLDFSEPFLQHAEHNRPARGDRSVSFACANARAVPLASGSVDALYSLSSLYHVPALGEVFAEIARILRPAGRCVLDLGVRPSLNTVVCSYYPELAVSCHVTVDEILASCRASGLTIVEHRCFQILPMWGDRPWWLKPLLHPVWTRLLAIRVKGRMLDEWISSLPVLRRFAFRHVLLCEKASG
jgi:ubiquinone/menaquinone biosynthesis C-methylase UbiE